MLTFTNPKWINSFYYPYQSFEEIPQSLFDAINRDLAQRTSAEPLVSIIISAWNEEINILRSVASLSKLDTQIPFEIIVVNNNSSDNTQLTVDKLHVRSLFEQQQGCGPARQKGQEHARGKYVLLADADSFYPPKWLDEMITILSQPGVVVVYGRYAFISEPGYPRWQLAILETLKNWIAAIRHYKRPYLNTYGLSMGYIKELGLRVGFIKSRFWGDDGALTYDLMKYGTVKQVKSSRAVIWTYPRTLQRDGTLFQAFKKRILRDLGRFGEFFTTKMKSHAPRE
jgi:glycosyltransferase involved in cell wall biosynthesis